MGFDALLITLSPFTWPEKISLIKFYHFHHVAYGTAKDAALGRIKPGIAERAVEGQFIGDIPRLVATSFAGGRLH